MIELLPMPLWLEFVIVAVVFSAATIFLVRFTGGQDHSSRSNDNVATAVIRFVGGAFVFIGAFSIVTAWQSTNAISADIQHEFGAMSIIAEDTMDEQSPVAHEIRQVLVDYAMEVRTHELAHAPHVVHSNKASQLLLRVSALQNQLAETGTVPQEELATMYKDFDALKQARFARFEVSPSIVPDAVIGGLLIMGAIFILINGLYPSGPSRLIKWVQSLSGLAVVLLIVGMVLTIESPEVNQVSFNHPIDVFLGEYASS